MSLRQLVNLVRADFAQKGKASDRLTVVIFRFGQYAVGGRGRVVARALHRIVDLVWVRSIVGAELPATASIGAGLRLPHWGRGVILHPKTVIGENAYIYHGVTIGLAKDGTPVLGDRVYVGAGAKILGPVKIGDGAKIGAGAVVLSDVPPGATAVGVPARTIQ